MTSLVTVMFAAVAVLAATNWLARARGEEVLEQISRPAVTAMLIAIAITVQPRDPVTRQWFVAALAVCLLGDVAIAVGSLSAVLAAFSLGHVAYVVGLAPHTGSTRQDWMGAIGVVVIASVMAWLLLPRAAWPLKAGVLAYIVALSIMVATAGATGQPIVAASALNFFAAAGITGWRKFRGPVPGGRVGAVVIYHVAQTGFVLSLIYPALRR